MEALQLDPAAWICAVLAAVCIGCAKTGLPGLGILAVALMASGIPGKRSVGVVLPLLIVADCCAVAWYRRHADVHRLVDLAGWVAVGLAFGALALWAVDLVPCAAVAFRPIIGGVVLLMLLTVLVRQRLARRVEHGGRGAAALTGTAAGTATVLANAAGPLMGLYLASKGLSKAQFLGTMAWFFLLLNLSKVPIHLVVGWLQPHAPLIDAASLLLDLYLLPALLAGVLLGRFVLFRLPRRWFFGAVFTLAGASAVKLLLAPWI
ncbi:MAG: TSUP family transporter [Planctomycetota bacterium]